MSEQNTEKSKTPYIIGVIILVVVGWYIWGGSDTCTLADNADHVCADSKVHGCEAHECDATVEGCEGYDADAAAKAKADADAAAKADADADAAAAADAKAADDAAAAADAGN